LAALNAAFDVVLRHEWLAGLLDRQPEAQVGVRDWPPPAFAAMMISYCQFL